MALSLNNTVVARIAAALYGQQLGAASMTEALSEVSNLGSVEAWANQVFSRDFGTPTLALASTILKYVGVADDAKSTLATWLLGQLNTPKPGTTLVSLLNSFAATPAGSTYAAQAAAFNTTIAAATSYASTYGTSDITLAQAALTGATVTLTTGADTATGNTINADLSSSNTTLQGFDTITGAGATNKLNIIDSVASDASVLPVGASISNIQSIVLSTAGNAGGSNTFDVSKIAGVTKVTVSSGGTGTDSIKAASTTDIVDTYNGTATGTNSISTNGGNNVTITDNGSTAVKVGTSSPSASTVPAGAIIVNENSSGANVAVDGGTSVSVTATKASSSANGGTITIGSNVAPTGSVTVVDSAGGQSTASYGLITVSGGTSASVTVNDTSNVYGNPVTVNNVSGAVTVNMNAATSGASTAITVDDGTTLTVSTTGGNVTVGNTSGHTGPSGVITITDTNANTYATPGSSDAFNIPKAPGSVSLTTTPTSGTITIGSTTTLTTDPTGPVTVNNSSTFGSNSYYGTSAVNIYPSGSSTISVTGGAAVTITDEAAVNALTTVTLNGDGVSSASSTTASATALSSYSVASPITSTALNTVNVNNSSLTDAYGNLSKTPLITATNLVADNTLNLNLSGDSAKRSTFTDRYTFSTTGNSSDTVTFTYAGQTGTYVASATAATAAAHLAAALNTILPGTATYSDLTTLGTAAGVVIVSPQTAGTAPFPVTIVSRSGAGAPSLAADSPTVANWSAGSITQVVSNASKVINITASGTSAINAINLTDTDNPATGSKTINLVNNGTGTLFADSMTLTNGSSALTIAGTGPVSLGNVTAGSNAPTSITSTSSGAVSATIDGTVTSFSGGSGPSTITVVGSSTGLSKSINGGTSGNNTAVLVGPTGNYNSSIGAGLTNFQNLQLNGGSTGSYTATSFTGGLINNQVTAPVTFASVVPGTPLTVLAATSTALNGANLQNNGGNTVSFTVGTSTSSTDVITLVINGVTLTVTAAGAADATALAIYRAINKAALQGGQGSGLYGVSASVSAAGTGASGAGSDTAVIKNSVTITGAYSVTGVSALTSGGNATTATLFIPGNKFDTSATGTYPTGYSVLLAPGASSSNSHLDNLNPINSISETYSTANSLLTGNTLPLTLNSASGSASTGSVINESNNQFITINSVKDVMGGSTDSNKVTIIDGTLLANANNAQSITVTGNGSTTVIYQMNAGGSTQPANAMALIDGSASTGSLNTVGVIGATSGITIKGGTGSLTAYGSGVAETSPTAYDAARDVITTGAGGGTITIGYGGAGSGTGSETINLGATTAKSVTLITPLNGTIGARATVNGFNISSSSTTNDKITFQKDVVYSADTVQVPAQIDANGATVAALVAANIVASTGVATDPYPVNLLSPVTTASATANADTYTVSNGIITFTGADTVAQQIADAQAIVNAAASTNSDYEVAAFTASGDTYVVESGATTAKNVILTLKGVTGVTQLGGSTAAVGNITSNDVGYSLTAPAGRLAAATGVDIAGAVTADDTGYSVQAISLASSGLHTFNNLAPSSTLNITSTGTFSLATTQLGTAGSDSLTLNLNATAGGTTLTTATVIGDATLTINSIEAAATPAVISNLVDSGATLTGVTISNTLAANYENHSSSASVNYYDGAVTISAITDAALKTISITDTANVIIGASSTPLTQAGLTVSFSTGSSTYNTTGVDAVYLSGAGATIDASSTSTFVTATGTTTVQTTDGSHGGLILSATGDKSVIKGGTGVDTIIAGTNATVTMAQGSVTGGAGNHKANFITVGAGSTVTLGTAAPITVTGTTTVPGVAYDGGSDIILTSPSGGASAVAGATSSGAYTMVTINNWVHGSTKVDFFGTGTEVTGTYVNASSATSLSSALDLAASQLSSSAASGYNTYDYFQYGGNTYVLGHTGAAETAMSANDIIVKLTGLDDPALTASSHHILL